MLMWSTYASNYDNPVRFADPLGDMPDCCPPPSEGINTALASMGIQPNGFTNWLGGLSDFAYSAVNPIGQTQAVYNKGKELNESATRLSKGQGNGWDYARVADPGDIVGTVRNLGRKIKAIANGDMYAAGQLTGDVLVAGATRGSPSSAPVKSGKYLYHYTSKEAAPNISKQGLRVGRDGFSYLTNKSDLSPLQAQIELALPANRALPNSILRIKASRLTPAMVRRSSGNMPGYGAGGGTEYLFTQHIPAELIQIVK